MEDGLPVKAFGPSPPSGLLSRGKGPLDLDDTLFRKCGRRIEDAAWWRDAVRSTGQNVVKAFGHNLLVLALRVHPPWGGEPLALPMNMRLHRKGGKPLFDQAREMVGEVLPRFPNREFDLCADGFYAPLAGSLPPGVFLTSRLRRDAALFNLPPRREKPTGAVEEEGGAATHPPGDGRGPGGLAACGDGGEGESEEAAGAHAGGPVVVGMWGYTDSGGDIQRCGGRGTGRYPLHHRPPRFPRGGYRALRRQVDYRGHLPQREAVPGRRGSPELEG